MSGAKVAWMQKDVATRRRHQQLHRLTSVILPLSQSDAKRLGERATRPAALGWPHGRHSQAVAWGCETIVSLHGQLLEIVPNVFRAKSPSKLFESGYAEHRMESLAVDDGRVVFLQVDR